MTLQNIHKFIYGLLKNILPYPIHIYPSHKGSFPYICIDQYKIKKSSYNGYDQVTATIKLYDNNTSNHKIIEILDVISTIEVEKFDEESHLQLNSSSIWEGSFKFTFLYKHHV